MIYLLLGGDRAAKTSKIAQYKKQYLPSNDALYLDFQSIESRNCEPAELKKSLIALPAVAKQRLILINSPEKLTDQNKNIILEFLESGHDHAVVILNADSLNAKSNFYKTIAGAAEVFRFTARMAPLKVWDVTDAIVGRDPTGALDLLDQLIEGGENPIKIMGGLVWFWGSRKNRLSKQNFKKGLVTLQEADLNIKRSRLKPEYAVEIAITKLSGLLS